MYPHERSLVEQLAGKPFAIVGVNSDDDLGAIRKIVKEKNLTWRSFQNERADGPSISDSWDIAAWPTIYIIDAEGKVRAKDPSDLDTVITELLAEMGHDVTLEHNEQR